VTSTTRSFKVAVKANNDTTWAYNMKRFAQREDAEQWGAGLAMRWFAVRTWEVQESEDEPTD
jgi:hypothetical protein